MAPEQFQGAATPLSDQYAFACLAYELLTGQPPFEGDDFMSLARKHAAQEPLPPSQLQPRRAQHIDHVLLKALVKQPAGRYPDMQTFLAELSAPPPLVALSSIPESILGVAQPPAVSSDPQPAVLSRAVDVSEMSTRQEAFPTASAAFERKTTQQELSQEMLPAALAVFDAETTTQEPREVLPALLGSDVHEVTTIVIPAAVMPGSTFGADQRIGSMPATMGSAFGADRQGLTPAAARLTNLPARVRSTPHFSRRQVWLTVVLAALAMLISLSGIALFFNLASNHPPVQSHAGGATTTPSPTSQPGQTPTSTTVAAAGIAVASSPTATATHKPKPTPKPSPTSAKPTPTAIPTTPAASPTATATTAASLSCKVAYQLSSQWSNGFVANLTITNTGGSSIQGWSLVFTFPTKEMILSGWNGHFAQSSEQVTITNDNSDPTLAPGASVTPGFQAVSSQKK